jgi:RNA polymerase sigma-70 factor, ECF subfamily
MEEKELFHKIQRGDTLAFEILFHRYYGVLCVFAEKMLHSREAAEDIVQEMFSKVWMEREYMEIDTSLKAFLYRSIKNRCLNYLRHLEIIQHHEQDTLYSVVDIADDTGNPDEELLTAIYASVQQLPPQCQKVFKMSRFEGLKHKEIAGELGISIKTVKIHIGKALVMIRERVGRKER